MKLPLELQSKVSKEELAKFKKSLPGERTLASASEVFKALSNPVRLKILFLLCKQKLCVCLIKEICQISDSKLSYHLSVLKKVGLIECQTDGNWLIYFPTERGRKVVRLALNLLA